MAKVGISIMTSSVTQAKLAEFAQRFFPDQTDLVRLPTKNQTIMSPPEGYVGMYIKSFTVSSVRYPFSPFFLDVLKYYGRHVSLMHPQGHSKIIAFEIMCRAFGGEPNVELFKRFATIYDAGEWVTIANRARGVGCVEKGGVDVRNWKKEFVFVSASLFSVGCESLVDRENLIVESTAIDPLPEGGDNGPLFKKLCENHFVVWAYPENVLFKAGVINTLPAGKEALDDMSFMSLVRRGTAGVAGGSPMVIGATSQMASPYLGGEAEVSSRPPLEEDLIPPPVEGVATSEGAAGDEGVQDQVEEEVVITGSTKGKAKVIEGGGVASRLRAKRRGNLPPTTPAKTKKTTKVPTTAATAEAEHLNEGPEDSSSGDEWYEATPKEKEQLRMLEECSYDKFVKIFNKDFERHSKIGAAASVRLLEGALELRRVRGQLEEREKECGALRAKVKEVDAKAKQAEGELKQVGVLKEKMREGEAAIKLQDEELRSVKAKLAQSQSELGQEKANLDMVQTLVSELTQRVHDCDAERAGLSTEVIPYACRALVDSDELGQWVGPVISYNRDDERAMILKELSDKGLVDLKERAHYDPDVALKIEKAIQDYRCAEFPFVERILSNPKASYHELLAIKPEKVQQVPTSAQPASSSPAPPQGPPIDGTSTA